VLSSEQPIIASSYQGGLQHSAADDYDTNTRKWQATMKNPTPALGELGLVCVELRFFLEKVHYKKKLRFSPLFTFLLLILVCHFFSLVILVIFADAFLDVVQITYKNIHRYFTSDGIKYEVNDMVYITRFVLSDKILEGNADAVACLPIPPARGFVSPFFFLLCGHHCCFLRRNIII
jgi:hypothetical protein